MLNARIRKRWRMGNVQIIGLIGERVDLTYPYDYLGAGTQTLASLASWARAISPRASLGAGEEAAADASVEAPCRARAGLPISRLPAKLAQAFGLVREGWNGFSVLSAQASRVGGLDLGCVPGEGGLDAAAMAKPGALDVVYLLGADEITVAPGAFVIYQGTHGDRGAHRADVILPGAAYTEKSGTYVNTEGRVQMAARAIFPPGDAREDWAILRGLSGALGLPLPFHSLGTLRKLLYATHPHLGEIDHIVRRRTARRGHSRRSRRSTPRRPRHPSRPRMGITTSPTP